MIDAVMKGQGRAMFSVNAKKLMIQVRLLSCSSLWQVLWSAIYRVVDILYFLSWFCVSDENLLEFRCIYYKISFSFYFCICLFYLFFFY